MIRNIAKLEDHVQVNSRGLQGLKKLLVILRSQSLDLKIHSIIGRYHPPLNFSGSNHTALVSIPAFILLYGKSLKCLYLSQISTMHSVKKHLNASVLPQSLSTHLTSSFNFRKVQIWPRTFPMCTITSS